MSKYGEPWFVDGFNIKNRNDVEVTSSGNHCCDCYECHDGGFCEFPNAMRTVACVNALADVKNPEAVKELLDNLKKYIGIVRKCDHQKDCDCDSLLYDVHLMLNRIRFTED